jgi:hypothetical protein
LPLSRVAASRLCCWTMSFTKLVLYEEEGGNLH